MASVYQQAATQRKIIYLASIAVLLFCTLFVRGVVKVPVPGVKEPVYALSIDGRAKTHELTELNQGDTELAGSTVRLLLTGSRGLAVCALWNNAIEKQKKHEWNELDLSVKSITKLQPHFMAPWLFQSWNIAYNVSVEMDRINDMYFYIARGITIIAEGDNLNRHNPDLRYWVAFYYQNKFGTSDKVTTLRCLYQLSCIPDEDRDPERLLNPNRSINLEKFEEFCTKNPQLVRRMKETRILVDGSEEKARSLAYSPNDVITFLRNNRKLPTRYRANTRELLDRLQQFPVLPDMTGEPTESEEQNFRKDIGDEEADAFLAARTWYAHSLNAVPPPVPIPGVKGDNPDPYRYRFPRRPALIIFRHGPMRAQSYYAERLTKEGWFDKQEPWEIDDLSPGQIVWIPKVAADGKTPISAKFSTPVSAQEAWKSAAQRWRQHGERTGLYMDSARLKNYLDKAEAYVRLRPGLNLGAPTPALSADEAADPEKTEAHDAHFVMFNFIVDRQMTNYEMFDLEAQGMSTDEAMFAKKMLAKAEKLRLEARDNEAIPLYVQGFESWKKAIARQDCRARRALDPSTINQSCRDFRDLHAYQEEMYDLNVKYLKIMNEIDREKRRSARRWVSDLTLQLGANVSPLQWVASLNVMATEEQVPTKEPQKNPLTRSRWDAAKNLTPLMLPGPLDGDAPDGTPWIPEDVQNKIKLKYGLIKPPPMPKAPEEGGPTTTPGMKVE